MTKDEALKMAIEAMEDASSNSTYWEADMSHEEFLRRIQTCKEALAQPAQEPVAYLKDINNPPFQTIDFAFIEEEGAYPVYTHPAPSWQGLSDDEIDKLRWMDYMDGDEQIALIREAEAKLKEKNHD